MPIVVTGFEPLDLLEGILMAIRQLEEGRAEVENQYVRAVQREGVPARPAPDLRGLRGRRRASGAAIGAIPASGYRLRDAYARFDAERKFDVGEIRTNEHPACIAGAILTGDEDAARLHRVRHALLAAEAARRADGVSSEGTCAAFFAAGRGPRRRRSPRPVSSAPLGAGRRRSAAGRAGSPRLARGRRRAPADGSSGRTIDPEGVACPAPIPEVERVILGHGSGGQLSGALLRDLIGPALARGVARAARSTTRPSSTVAGARARLHHRLVRREPDPASRAATSASWPSTARSTTWR